MALPVPPGSACAPPAAATARHARRLLHCTPHIRRPKPVLILRFCNRGRGKNGGERPAGGRALRVLRGALRAVQGPQPRLAGRRAHCQSDLIPLRPDPANPEAKRRPHLPHSVPTTCLPPLPWVPDRSAECGLHGTQRCRWPCCSQRRVSPPPCPTASCAACGAAAWVSTPAGIWSRSMTVQLPPLRLLPLAARTRRPRRRPSPPAAARRRRQRGAPLSTAAAWPTAGLANSIKAAPSGELQRHLLRCGPCTLHACCRCPPACDKLRRQPQMHYATRTSPAPAAPLATRNRSCGTA